jgi:hypothetical protein
MRAFVTQDGTVLVFDREEGVVSGRSREEAEAEIRRRKLVRQQAARGLA